ncbi:hypothetical protein RHMOL_Rhmol03G0116800 [Rhododendron molle]|uniref:Uncharacterized protein n=1 Tax=Rhododendron molle TaxID=49168 RepID=A0ACC0PFI1_RHOML|nr:hypothetical protein RHMOL_Rhmol03G0116800 [Rhododendron molle]
MGQRFQKVASPRHVFSEYGKCGTVAYTQLGFFVLLPLGTGILVTLDISFPVGVEAVVPAFLAVLWGTCE